MAPPLRSPESTPFTLLESVLAIPPSISLSPAEPVPALHQVKVPEVTLAKPRGPRLTTARQIPSRRKKIPSALSAMRKG